MPEKCGLFDDHDIYDSSKHHFYYCDASPIDNNRDRNHDNRNDYDAIDDYHDCDLDDDGIHDDGVHDYAINDNDFYVNFNEHSCNHDALWAAVFGLDAFQERTQPRLRG